MSTILKTLILGNMLQRWEQVNYYAKEFVPADIDIFQVTYELVMWYAARNMTNPEAGMPYQPSKENNWWPRQQYNSRLLYILQHWYTRGFVPYEFGMTFRTIPQTRPLR
jgi:hypothetical protein